MSGNSDELTRAYLDRLAISWNHLNGCEASTEFEFGGRKFATPIMAGGMAFYQKMHNSGIEGYAQAVTNAGSVMWSGYCDDQLVEACVAKGASFVRILKPLADRDLLMEWIRHDEEVGCIAFAMDIDHWVSHNGGADAFRGYPLKSMTGEDLRELAAASKLPFIVKGITSVADAKVCAKAGVYGILLSEHQNLFQWTVPPLLMLPEIKKAVGDSLKIYVDSCLDDGYACFKALALGADGVCMARALRTVFMEKGSVAVEQKLKADTATLKACLSKTASPDICHISRDCLVEL